MKFYDFGDEMMISSGFSYFWGYIPFFKYPTKIVLDLKHQYFFCECFLDGHPAGFIRS